MKGKHPGVEFFMKFLVPPVELCSVERGLSLSVIQFSPDDGRLLVNVLNPGDVPQINRSQRLSFRLTGCTGGDKIIKREHQAILFEETTSDRLETGLSLG